MNKELKGFMYAVTLEYINKSISKQENILRLILDKKDTFTKSAKITQRNARNQNKIFLIYQNIEFYKGMLEKLNKFIKD